GRGRMRQGLVPPNVVESGLPQSFVYVTTPGLPSQRFSNGEARPGPVPTASATPTAYRTTWFMAAPTRLRTHHVGLGRAKHDSPIPHAVSREHVGHVRSSA